ncbi:dTDP-4-amino-4,6-dideoxygalactose transaminase [Francisella sp. 19X1-34]|uniref:dTDP-4-amino-4,6-dideoxygalactose transaminase n=1 Tax=Francisella sp. 19X1-34 TaxID=3087177 RepID=UPI002E370763|nr:dTDP-4-amino-4,6-dideoxygalactose transaminase [Francisella sp. 19X1-34]MED7787565.1 dTDP-4-amino-4,6-dideoxygalactose transaminase [Francisella sp. 19X1-34]
MIVFNKPAYTSDEDKFVSQSMKSDKISGDGEFTKKCTLWFEENLKCRKALLTTSCTHALEMAAILLDIKPGDEVIVPSFTFVSTANAFVLRGAKIIFVDIRPDTMNIDESKIEAAITDKTKAIVLVHYAGVSCEMDVIMDIADRYNLFVVEDAAQGMMSSYNGKPLGTIGHIGAYSFHETKNYTSAGEGGLLIVNDSRFAGRAEIIREKGTNRCQFFRGMIDKYTWVDIGSSYLMNDVSAAYLWGNIQNVKKINDNRLSSWYRYYEHLIHLQDEGKIILPTIPDNCEHNAHMFYIKLKDIEQRTELISYLRKNGIYAVFHYVPLHSSNFGKKHTVFCGEDKFTTLESEKLVRLPMYYGLKDNEIDYVCEKIERFLK